MRNWSVAQIFFLILLFASFWADFPPQRNKGGKEIHMKEDGRAFIATTVDNISDLIAIGFIVSRRIFTFL